MNWSEVVAQLMVGVGLIFFLAGSIGLLRFPDVFARLHALTKADNLGLGLVLLGLAFQSKSWFLSAKLLLIWMLVLVGSASVCCLIAGSVERTELK